MSSCVIIPRIKSKEGNVDSPLFTKLYREFKIPRDKVIDIYYSTRTPGFTDVNGNWTAARLDWINGKFDSLESAKQAYNVSIETNELGEPTVNAISSILKDYGYTISEPKIKPGVSELFESNPELANIGTQEQYSQYLDTIFPDSKVKDILYHSSNQKVETLTEGYSENQRSAGFHFYNLPNTIYGNIINAALINVSNQYSPKGLDETREIEYLDKRTKETLKSKGFDYSLIYKSEYVVFESSQIHILGSKQDIEGFKKSVKNDKTESIIMYNISETVPAPPVVFKIYEENPRISDVVPTQEANRLTSRINGKYGNQGIYARQVAIPGNTSMLRIVLENKSGQQFDTASAKSNPKVMQFVERLSQRLPGINVLTMTYAEAQKKYNNKLNNMATSMIDGNTVILFTDRVTADTAIEEMLHPFVLAVARQNPELFSNLLAQAQKLYPGLARQIKTNYARYGSKVAQLELVTQVLSKAVHQEFEISDTRAVEETRSMIRKFFDALSEWFDFFFSFNISEYTPTMLEPGMSFEQIALLLNTEGLSFTQEFTDQIFYNIGANTSYVNQQQDYLERNNLEELPKAMKKTIDKLFVDSSKVKYDEVERKYSDGAGTIFKRVSDFIESFTYKGNSRYFAFEGIKEEFNTNIEWGNQIDNIFESVLMGMSESEAIERWKENSDFSVAELTEDVVSNLYKEFVKIKEEDYADAILIPQVVIFNKEKNIAGRADVVAVYPDGTIKVIDLKSSITSTKSFEYKKTYNTELGPKSSKQLRHAAQVSAYKGLFLSQGYEFNTDDLGIIPAYIEEKDDDVAEEVVIETPISVAGLEEVVASLDTDNSYTGESFADKKIDKMKAKSIIDKVLKLLAQRKLILERQGTVKASAFKKKEIETLEETLKNAEYIKSVTKFIDDAYNLFITKRMPDGTEYKGLAYEIRNKVNALRKEEDTLKVIDELLYYKNMVESYMPIMNEIREFYQKEIGFVENIEPGSELDKIRKIVDAQATVLSVYNNEILPDIADVLAKAASEKSNVAGKQFYERLVKRREELLKSGTPLDLKRAKVVEQQLKKMEARGVTSEGVTKQFILENLKEGAFEDIPLVDVWLSPAISSSNASVALFAKTLKEKFENARIKLIESSRDAAKAFEEYKEYNRKTLGKGRDNPKDFNEPFFEIVEEVYVDLEGKTQTKKVAKFVQPYDEQAYITEKERFKQSIANLSYGEKRSKWAEWYDKNHEILPENDEVIINPYTKKPVVIQKGRNTLIQEALEKKRQGIYTEYDFNNWLRSNEYTDENGVKHFRGQFTRPSRTKFPNAKYKAIQSNPSKKKYYDFLITSYFKAQERTPENSKLLYKLPSIAKNANDRLREQGLWKNIKYNVKEATTILPEDIESMGETIEGTKIVPLLFHNQMNINDISFDLISSVMRFDDATLKYEAQTSMAGFAEATLDLLKKNAPFKTDTLGNKYLDEAAAKAGIKDTFLKYKKKHAGNNVAALFEAFADMQIYGRLQIPAPMMFNLDANKLANSLMGFTSKVQLGGLNIVGNVANSMMNHVSVNIESAGSQYFTYKELAWAKYTYNMHVGDYLADFTEPVNKSFLGQLFDLYDPMQGDYRDKYGKKVSHSVFKKLWSNDTWFFLMHQTDHSIQCQVMLAYLKKTKVKQIVNGKTTEISLYDAYTQDKKTGKIKLKEGVQLEGKKDESGLLSMDVQNTIHAINKRMFGVYNNFDKVKLEQHWYGRLLLMYKKHVGPGFKRRYKGVSHDQELGDITEGYHRTFFRLLLTDTKRMAKAIYSSDSELQDFEKANLKKSLRDMMFAGGTGLMVMLLSAMAKAADDEDRKAYQFALFFALKLNTDLGVYGTLGDPQNLGFPNVQEMFKNVKSPAVALNTIDKFIRLLSQATRPDEVYERKSGMFEKGDSKLFGKFLKFVGITGTNLDPENYVKFMQSQQ